MIFTTNDRLPMQEQFNMLLDMLNMHSEDMTGQDGQHIHVAYADVLTGDAWTTEPTANTTYMGVAITGSEKAPVPKTAYQWMRVKGEQGAQGEAGSGGDKSYVHTQSTSSSTWTITHNLNKYPAVSVIDSAGTEVMGDVLYMSTNKVKISFSGAFSGKAYFN